MASNKTAFQRLTDVMIGVNDGIMPSQKPMRSVTYNISPSSDVIFSSNSKEERDRRLLQMKQNRLMAYQWAKTGYETSMEQMAGASQVRVMYRDADLMAAWPEINSALLTVAEEATTINSKGKILNIYSKSPRIKAVLEDLFINRLDFNIWGKTIFYQTAKYGNEYMFLNIDAQNGVLGWREMPVHEMQRIENGMMNAYSGTLNYAANANNLKPGETKFVWEGHDQGMGYKSWQIAHFRLITDSLYLPYGVSWLNSARRHWRMLSMMEDGMLLYRLERSIERRIFKVNVGLIDDADVPAFLQDFMNNVKRAPIIDPQTGQMDLRKNFLDVSADYVLPVRPGQDPTSIDVLQSAQNQTSMDDINYMQNKVLCALRIPKSFLNFQEAQGKAQNLSLMDIRFNRTVNGIQQAILTELNKIAIIHLYLLGFEDELTNFTLSLNNPSNQIEMMELDNLTKRLAAATSALAEQGGGIPIMSWHRVQREIMGLTDDEIADMLNEIRLEAGIAIEIQRTSEIIKKTGVFDKVDRIYGEPGAKYSANPPGQEGGGALGGGGGAPMMGGGFGDDLGDLGEPGSDTMGDIGGEEGSQDLGSMDMSGGSNEGAAPLSENSLGKSLFLEDYFSHFNLEENKHERVEIYDKALMINESINSTLQELDSLSKSDASKELEVLSESNASGNVLDD